MRPIARQRPPNISISLPSPHPHPHPTSTRRNTRMALHTPLARLGTFLFPTQTRRVSAPPPESPHDGPKRRSAIAASDSPPRCRRRLSFADTDVVIEYPPCTTPPPILDAAIALQKLPAEQRPAAWANLAALASSASTLPGLDDPALREVFLAVFGGGYDTPASVEELTAAAEALDAVLSNSASPLSARDEPLVDAILHIITVHVDSSALVEAAANVVLGDDWSRVFTRAVSRAAAPLAKEICRAVARPDLEPTTWDAMLQLLAVCAEAMERACVSTGSELKCEDGQGLELSRADAAAVIASFERLADRNVAFTESALRSLVPLFANKAVAAVFAVENASAVISEVSSTYLQMLSIQHACIDLLVTLSSPKIFSYATYL